jgi:hypothetical protein
MGWFGRVKTPAEKELEAARRTILRTLDQAKAEEIRRERGPLHRRVLAGVLALGLFGSVTVISMAPFQIFDLWSSWFAPYGCGAIWTVLFLWLSKRTKGFFERVVSKRTASPYRSGECRDWRSIKTPGWHPANLELWRT